MSDSDLSSYRMTPTERRASLGLASIFALRMLGLFLVLPVFALEARRYPGGDDPAWIGFAMGVYGLTQAVLQIPVGVASDRWGRKPVILWGLALFALGSVGAAWATTVQGLAFGRALQGAGAISAAVTAFIADATRDSVRTKAMALVGMGIATMFALSLGLAPVLADWIGLSGIFALTAGLALLGMWVVVRVVPPEPVRREARAPVDLGLAWRDPALRRLNVGVFALHAVQLALWMAVPRLLEQAGLAASAHWRVYVPAIVVAFLLMGGVLFRLERKGHLRPVFIVSIALLACVSLSLWWLAAQAEVSLALLTLLLCVFFTAFNMLEASQPSLVSKWAPVAQRGGALGVYNTLQSLGFFVGGALGGWLFKQHGPSGVFAFALCLSLCWLWVAWPMKAAPPAKP